MVVSVVALVATGALAAPATAQERRPVQASPVSDAGEGIAPGAPAAVRERVRAVLEGRGPAAPQEEVRSLQGRSLAANWYGCRTVWAYRGYDNWLGYNLFRYYQQVSWCSNGYSIYSWSRDRWPEVNMGGWRFHGHIGSSLGGPTYRKDAWTQGEFSFCAGGCWSYKYPWVSISVYLDGGWDADSGG